MDDEVVPNHLQHCQIFAEFKPQVSYTRGAHVNRFVIEAVKLNEYCSYRCALKLIAISIYSNISLFVKLDVESLFKMRFQSIIRGCRNLYIYVILIFEF